MTSYVCISTIHVYINVYIHISEAVKNNLGRGENGMVFENFDIIRFLKYYIISILIQFGMIWYIKV